jgi:hypothetical protein
MCLPDIDTSEEKGLPCEIPCPLGSGYLDQVTYRSVHFHGARPADALTEAAHYLRQIEKLPHNPPSILCVHVQFSWEDGGSDLAWQVTIVLGEPITDDNDSPRDWSAPRSP